ncbi:hypothetical protein GmRootV59_16120 [Variovorax sp. V59]
MERRRGGMRAAAAMRELARRIGASNPHQFAGRFDAITGMRTQTSGKWRQCFTGEKALSVQQLRLLSCMDADAITLHDAGPCDLWLALWGEPGALWQLCRTRLDSDGPMIEDTKWSEVADGCMQARSFEATLAEFEAELLLAEAYGQPLTLRHLTETVALFRLHGALSALAVMVADSQGLARCLQACFTDAAVHSDLTRLGVVDGVGQELAEFVDSPGAAIPAMDRWDALALKVAWIG